MDKYLKKKKVVRNQNIPIKTWIASLSEEEKLLINYNELLEIVSQYHIYRFSDKDLPKTRLKLIYKELKKLKKLKK